ncbi:putative reverse transcriptase domain-containing protein [Tanacetum coccineum]
MAPRAMTQAAIEKLVSDKVATTLAHDRATRGNTTRASGPGGNTGGNAQGQGGAPPAHECIYLSFMKCNPTSFHGNEGAVELCGRGRGWGDALTWWNSQVATLGLELVNAKSWNDMKIMISEEFCPPKEIQRMEVELATKSVHCGKMGHKEHDCISKNVASGTNARSAVVCYECGERGHKSNTCPKRADRQGGNVRGQAYVVRDAEHNQGPNVVTGTFLLNNHYVTILFDLGPNKSFVDVRFSHLLDIKPTKLNTSYEVELADGKVVCTNTVLKGYTLNLLDHLFDIDLMPIELGTFDVIIGMNWLVERNAVIVCGKKELFLAQVIEKEPSKKQLQDVPVIRNFPEVFPDDLPRLPPPQQVEFRIELMPGAALVARAPYCLAPSELKELSDQLKELLEKGFILPSSSPWGAPVLFVKKKDVSAAYYSKNRICGLVITNSKLEKKISPLQLFRLASEALKSIQELADHSHKWHNKESKNTPTPFGIIDEKRKALNHEMDELKVDRLEENVNHLVQLISTHNLTNQECDIKLEPASEKPTLKVETFAEKVKRRILKENGEGKPIHTTSANTDHTQHLQKLVSHELKSDEVSMVKLNDRCSGILQNELPPKEKDPGNFILPCAIGTTTVNNALASPGASISIIPFSLFKRLGLGNPKPINMVIEMTDRSMQSPKGIVENVLVKINKFIFHVDFIIPDIIEDDKETYAC